jgi:hypothetical protein
MLGACEPLAAFTAAPMLQSSHGSLPIGLLLASADWAEGFQPNLQLSSATSSPSSQALSLLPPHSATGVSSGASNAHTGPKLPLKLPLACDSVHRGPSSRRGSSNGSSAAVVSPFGVSPATRLATLAFVLLSASFDPRTVPFSPDVDATSTACFGNARRSRSNPSPSGMRSERVPAAAGTVRRPSPR